MLSCFASARMLLECKVCSSFPGFFSGGLGILGGMLLNAGWDSCDR